VAKDAPNFGVIQGMVAVVLLGVVVAVLAFWPARWTHLLNRLTNPK
jgi:Flp pilus assembly pilin Flp